MHRKIFSIFVSIASIFFLFSPVYASYDYCCVGRAKSDPNKISECKDINVAIPNDASVACVKLNTTTVNFSLYPITPSKCETVAGCPSAFSGSTASGSGSATTDAKPPEQTFTPIEPKLQINIPTVEFSKAVVEGGYVRLPQLAQYIAGVFKYSVAIISIVATVMIMIGGLLYLTSGGSADRVGRAKETISGAAIGLILALGSYMVLYVINPDLVSFEALKVKIIERNSLEIVDRGDVCDGFSSATTPKKISDTTHDDVFKKYASTAGVDWQVLKAIAYKESSLVATTINKTSGAAGLFQIMGKCSKTDTPSTATGACKQALDPDYNTQLGAKMLKSNLDKVRKYCPNADKGIIFTLLYMAHNSGAGATYCATHEKCSIETQKGKTETITSNGGCSLDKIKQGIIAFWNNHYKKSIVGSSRGIKTFDYSVSTANLILSLTGGQALSGGGLDCPAGGTSSKYKILAIGDSITAGATSYAYRLKKIYTTDIIAKNGKQTGWMWQRIANKDLKGYTHLIILGGVNDISSATPLATTESNLTKIYQKAKNSNLKVVGITLSPWKGWPSWSTNNHNKTLQLSSWIQSQSIDYKIDFYSLVKDPNDAEKLAPQYDSTDHLHPNATAHDALYNKIIQTVFPN